MRRVLLKRSELVFLLHKRVTYPKNFRLRRAVGINVSGITEISNAYQPGARGHGTQLLIPPPLHTDWSNCCELVSDPDTVVARNDPLIQRYYAILRK